MDAGYKVCENLKEGWKQTFPDGFIFDTAEVSGDIILPPPPIPDLGACHWITVFSGAEYPDRNFGNHDTPPEANPGEQNLIIDEGTLLGHLLSNISPDANLFEWSFDGNIDGTFTGPSAEHFWDNNSPHSADVVITDLSGNSTTYVYNIEVNNVAPDVDTIDDITITLGGVIDLSANGTDPGTDNLTYEWDMGNGVILTGKTINYEYPETGVFNVVLTVNDNDSQRPGHENDTDGITTTEFQVTVKQQGSILGASTLAETGANTAILNLVFAMLLTAGTGLIFLKKK